MAAKLSGCDPIIAVDIRANRLELARSLGATHAIDNARHDAVAKIRAITGGAHLRLRPRHRRRYFARPSIAF
jgi:aryl-alcohol dehydrogenase